MNLIQLIGMILIFDAFYSLQARWKEGLTQNLVRLLRLYLGVFFLVTAKPVLGFGIILILDSIFSIALVLCCCESDSTPYLVLDARIRDLHDAKSNYLWALRGILGVIIILGVLP